MTAASACPGAQLSRNGAQTPTGFRLITKKGVDLLKNEFCSTATSPGVLQRALQHRLVVISIWCAPASDSTTALEFDTGLNRCVLPFDRMHRMHAVRVWRSQCASTKLNLLSNTSWFAFRLPSRLAASFR